MGVPNVVLRKKAFHPVFDTKIVSTLLSRSVVFPCVVKMSTKVYSNFSCVSGRGREGLGVLVGREGSGECVKTKGLLGREDLFKLSFMCSAVPGGLCPFS